LPRPLSLWQGQWSVSHPPAVSVLWWFTACFSILQSRLTLGFAHWLRRWVLWAITCPVAGSSLSLAHCWPFCISSLCLLKVSLEISSVLLPPFPVHFQSSHPLCHVLVFSSLFIVQLFVFLGFFGQGGESIWPEGYADWSQGWLGEYHAMLGTHLFSLLYVSQAGLELVSGSSGSPPVFSV
jgi:hypothetical protein